MSRTPDTDDLQLAERAAQWYGALRDGKTNGEAVFGWLAQSPRHVDEMLSTLVLAQDIAQLNPEQLARIEQMAEDAGEPDPYPVNVVPLGEPAHQTAMTPTAQPRRRLRWKAGAGIAAGILLLAGGAWIVSSLQSSVYETAIGEQRTLELTDGSVVFLNADSRVQVQYNGETRLVRLLDGQALFKVAHESARPFVVESGNTTVRALGTQFDIYRKATQTRVAVLEGLVQVSLEGVAAAPRVAAGQKIDVMADGRMGAPDKLNMEQALAWRQRRLIFQEDTLGEIAAEFNRYNNKLRVRVVGEAATNQHFSGTFDADAPETLMQALAGDETLIVERDGREILVRGR